MDNKTMKSPLFLILLTFMGPLFGADDDVEKSGVIVKNQSDNLANIIEEFDDVGVVIKECEQKIKNREINESDKDDCVWGSLDEGTQNKIIEHLEQTKDGKEVTDTSANYTGNFKQSQSKATKVLQDYLGKRLEKAMYGERDANGIKDLGDHNKYYELYKSQLGRTLISTLSGYCIYSDPETGFVPKNDNVKANYFRRKNLESLNTIVQAPKSGEEVSGAFSGFNKCIAKIGEHCRTGPSDNSSYDKDDDKEKDNTDRGIPHPCEINKYMTGVRKSIASLDDVIEETGKTKNSAVLGIQNVDRPDEEFKVDNVVNIGSKEVVEDSGYKEALEEEKQVMEECAQDPTNGDCEKYITNKEDDDELINENYIRGLAAQKKLENELEEAKDVDELKKYLLDQGVVEENFDKILQAEMAKNKDKDPFEVLKELIRNQKEKEKDALHESLVARLKSSQVDRSENANEDPDEKIQNIFEKKTKSLSHDAEDLAAVFHYGNVVSSFIEVTGEGGSSRNTKALATELDNNFFAPGRNVANDGSQDKGLFADGNALDQVGGFAEDFDGSDGDAVLDASDIDQIQYGIGEEDKGQNP